MKRYWLETILFSSVFLIALTGAKITDTLVEFSNRVSVGTQVGHMAPSGPVMLRVGGGGTATAPVTVTTRVQIDGKQNAGVWFTVNGTDAGTIRGTPQGIEVWAAGAAGPSLVIGATQITAMVPVVDSTGAVLGGAAGVTGPPGPPGPMGPAGASVVGPPGPPGISPCTPDPAAPGWWLCPSLTVPNLHVTETATFDGRTLGVKYQ